MSLRSSFPTAGKQRPPLPDKNVAGVPTVQSRVERFGLKPPEDPVRLARNEQVASTGASLTCSCAFAKTLCC